MREDKPVIQMTKEGVSIKELNIVDCNIFVNGTSTSRYILSSGSNPHALTSVNFSNNIFYNTDNLISKFRLINASNDKAKNQISIGDIKIVNNTFVNICYDNSSAVLANEIENATVTKNITYFNKSLDTIDANYHNFLRAFSDKYPAAPEC